MASLELPGFYRDPVTGKYYKDIPGNEIVNKLKKNRILEKKKQLTNVPFLLKNSEMGLIGDGKARKSFQTKLFTMKQIYSATYGEQNEIEDVEYLKGGKNSIYCIWSTTTQNTRGYIFGHIIKRHLQPRNSRFYMMDNYIQDLADDFFASEDSLVFVENNEDGQGCICLWCHPTNTTFGYSDRINLNIGPLFCVETGGGRTSGHMELLAGGDSHMFYFDLRAMKPSVHFFGHTHALKKRPLSFVNELLCVSGRDNVVRIWHSSGGLPLHEIRPDFPENQQRGWLTSEGVKPELYIFERQSLRVFQLE